MQYRTGNNPNEPPLPECPQCGSTDLEQVEDGVYACFPCETEVYSKEYLDSLRADWEYDRWKDEQAELERFL